MAVGTHPLPTNLLQTCDGLLYCVAQWANVVTNGFWWTGVLMGFVIMLFIATQRFGTPRSFGFASVMGLLGSLWLVVLDLMSWWVASIFILVGLTGFASMILSER